MKEILKYLWIGVSVCLVVMITFCIFFQPKHKNISMNLKAKSLKSTTFAKKVEMRVVEEVKAEEPAAVQEEPVKEPVVVPTPVVESPSLDTQVGTMSAYGPDCAGCSGYLANGHYAGGGNIYYEDATYGVVRIVAGDRQYKTGSIIKVL